MQHRWNSKEGDPEVPHVFCGPKGWRGGSWVAVDDLPKIEARYSRWIAHCENRLAYERAMLAESGGTAADKFDFQPGGRILERGEWCVIIRVNRINGAVNSLTIKAPAIYHWMKTSKVEVERVTDYQPPTVEDAAKVKAATKLPPLCNYPGEGFRQVTKAQWDKTYSDYKSSRSIGATETASEHRVRYLYNGGGSFVFLADSKRVDPPAPTLAKPEPIEFERDIVAPAFAPRPPAPKDPDAAKFEALRETIKAGVQITVAPQLFPTPPELARRMVEEAAIDPRHPCRILEPSAGTGAIIDALPDTATVHCVEINNPLCRRLNTMPKVFSVTEADFLECNGNLGKFDRILMNPPFENGADIKHITHAISFLKPGGKLVAICANGPRQNEKLRPLADTWEPLPEGTFKESGTGVNTVLLTIDALEVQP